MVKNLRATAVTVRMGNDTHTYAVANKEAAHALVFSLAMRNWAKVGLDATTRPASRKSAINMFYRNGGPNSFVMSPCQVLDEGAISTALTNATKTLARLGRTSSGARVRSVGRAA